MRMSTGEEASAGTSLTTRFRRTSRSGGKNISERPAGRGYSGFVATVYAAE